MKRTLLFVFGGLLLGGIIHIAVVFLVPYFAEHDAWAEVHSLGADAQFHLLSGASGASAPVAALDPWMLQTVCSFSLADRPVRIRASLTDDFWSIAIFDRRGRNVYSLNDRAAERAQLDLVVLTPVQMAQVRQNPPQSLEDAIVVDLPIENGFAVIRLFVPDESKRAEARAALASADCAGSL